MILFVAINGRSARFPCSFHRRGREEIRVGILPSTKEEDFFLVTSLLVFNVGEEAFGGNRARYLTTSIFPISESTDAYRRIDQRKEGRV